MCVYIYIYIYIYIYTHKILLLVYTLYLVNLFVLDVSVTFI